MAVDPRNDIVARQYKRWRYPEPILNLESWIASNWERFDPSHSHRLMWPDRPYQPGLEILSAGCGTNQAPVIAYTNPSAKVTAIDISEESLDHGRYLKDKYGLTNLELRLLPIEDVDTLGKSFDLIMCTGVLHHMDSPETGMRALAGVLRPDGVAAIMVYARYGRLGVEIMQSVFRDMGLRQDDASLQMVKTALDALPAAHPVRQYVSVAPDLPFDAGLVDTFLHGRDRSYTVDGCLRLVESAGLVFQDWLLKANYYPSTLGAPEDPFVAAVAALPERRMWSVVEQIITANACHFFLATSPLRDPAGYRIDFTSTSAMDYIPVFRHGCGLHADQVVRPDRSMALRQEQLDFVRRVDGQLCIGEIARQVADDDGESGPGRSALDPIGLELFEGLWRADFVAIDSTRTA